MIVSCNCLNTFQDNLYGKGKRVANPLKGGASVRCTVCGKTQTVSVRAVKESKDATVKK